PGSGGAIDSAPVAISGSDSWGAWLGVSATGASAALTPNTRLAWTGLMPTWPSPLCTQAVAVSIASTARTTAPRSNGDLRTFRLLSRLPCEIGLGRERVAHREPRKHRHRPHTG